MKLNDKVKKLLDKACLAKFGMDFDQTYNMVEQQQKTKELEKGKKEK